MFWIDVIVGLVLTGFMLAICVFIFPDDTESVKELDD
jgi:hypothetical protein